MVLYAVGLVAVCGAIGLSTDVAIEYVNWQAVQKGADAAALAGANYLAGTGFTYKSTPAAGCSGDDAQKAACTYAVNNGLPSGANLAVTEPTASTVKVFAHRTTLPYQFGRVVGLKTYDVSATAIATEPAPVGRVPTGLFPVGLNCKKPCNLNNMDPGQSVTFGQKFAGGLSPGNWEWLALDASGGKTLQTTIENGATKEFSVGDMVNTKPGETKGPIDKALTNRLSKCPALTPDPCSNGGNPTNIPKDDPCLVIVPAVDFTNINGNGNTPIEGFAQIYLEGTNNETQLNGCFVSVFTGDVASATAPPLGPTVPPRLIQ